MYVSLNELKQRITILRPVTEQDGEGNLVEQIWTLKWSDGADQGVVRFTYDKGNKLVRKDVSDTVWYEYTYDQYGNQLTYGNDKFLTTYEYVAIQR